MMPTDDERDAIMSHLLTYADENRFRILAARDYGSRARGLESDSSDYDVFFIFAQPPADYALGADTETYTKEITPEESLLDTEIELHGWNLERFIGNDGLLGSNPSAMEFCASEEQYFMNELVAGHMQRMIDHAIQEFKPYALMNHYRSLAASNYGKYIEGDYKLTSDTSWGDLLDYIDIDWHAVSERACKDPQIDEEESTIGETWIEIHGYTEAPFGGSIDTDDALDDGLIEPTTLDRTNKRYLNIMQALLKARRIEEWHECPPMDAEELLNWSAGHDWLPGDAHTQIRGLINGKTKTGEIETGLIPELDDWIEHELGREIEIEPHVQRQPETAVIRGEARELYNTLDWAGL